MSFDNFFEEVKEEFNYEEKKKEFIDNLDMLKSMSVEEQTLYKSGKSSIRILTFKNMLISLIYSLRKFGNQQI